MMIILGVEKNPINREFPIYRERERERNEKEKQI